MEDVNILSSHMNKLYKMNIGLSKALSQHENHLSSFIATANTRMDNLLKGIQNNMVELQFIQAELFTTRRNFEQTLDYAMSILTNQVQTTTTLVTSFEELKFGIFDLLRGRLSPLLIPENILQDTLNDIHMLLQQKYPGFHLSMKHANEVYSSCDLLYSRNNSDLFITLKFPVSQFEQTLHLFKVESFPVPINDTSLAATQLIDIPDYFMITQDSQYYAFMKSDQLLSCSGSSKKFCSENIPLIPVTTSSCVLAIFGNDKTKVKSLCNFRYLHNVIKPDIVEISPNSLLLYRMPLLSMECRNTHKMVKGCDFCVFQLPCRCSVSTSSHFVAYRLGACHNTTSHDNITILHPVNLALLQHFFDNSYVDQIFADTTFSTPVNVSIPQIKFYKHEMSDIIAADGKAHLSLSKMAEVAKQDAVVFQSLTEPLLDGQIQLQNSWPSTSDIMVLCSFSLSVVLAVAFLVMVCKVRKMSIMLATLTRVSSAKAMATGLPSFVYEKNTESEQDVSHSLSIDITWDHANMVILVFNTVLLFVILYRFSKTRTAPVILLEVTSTKQCIFIPIMKLPLCPFHSKIRVPQTVSNSQIVGPWYSKSLQLSWSNFSVADDLTDRTYMVPDSVQLNVFSARKLARIIKHPFFIHLHAEHHGFLTTLSLQEP